MFLESGLQASGCLTDVCLTTGARDPAVDNLGLEVSGSKGSLLGSALIRENAQP